MTPRPTARALAALAALAPVTACGFVDPGGPHGKPTPQPTWTYRNVRAYGEHVAGAPPEERFAWDLSIAGGTAQWRECEGDPATSRFRCSRVLRERPAEDLIAYEVVGEASIDDASDAGADVPVLRLELAPRRKYVVPYR